MNTASLDARKIKVFIPSRGRADVISTPKLIPNSNYFVLVHSEAERAAYAANPLLDPGRLLVSNAAEDQFGLTRQRQYALDTQVEMGEWFIFVDDDMFTFTAVDPRYYNCATLKVEENGSGFWKPIFEVPCSEDRFYEIVAEMIGVAERVGAYLCGAAVTRNFFYRGRKWRTIGFVAGGFMIMKHWGYQFDHTIGMEDYRNTAEHLLQHGVVVVNNFFWAGSKMYQQGGMGTYEDRKDQRKADGQKLMEQYPGLFRFKDRSYAEPETDMGLRLTTSKQIATWRQGMIRRRVFR